jgi:hypothetical protein
MAQLLLLTLLALLAGCAAPSGAATPVPVVSVGGASPEEVAQNFFEDLGNAVKDPGLADAQTRKHWADQLAGYFAPNERDDQRDALATALASLVRGLKERDSTTKLSLELTMDRVEKVTGSDDGRHALVRPINAKLTLVYTTDRGSEEDETVGIEKLIGRSDVPVVLIGDRWYLTEG